MSSNNQKKAYNTYLAKKKQIEARLTNLSGNSSTDEEKLQNKINNYTTRLSAGGVNVNKELDSRNVVEKALNLPENQNFIFDILEVLNRPQEAIFGGVDAFQKGENTFGEGFMEGLTGKKNTSAKDLLMNSDTSWSDREGKVDAVDVAGFLGDVLLDPMDLIPVGKLKKVADVADTAKDTAKTIDTAADALGAVNKVDNAIDVAEDVTNQQRKILRGRPASIGQNTLENTKKVSEKAVKDAKKFNKYNKDMYEYNKLLNDYDNLIYNILTSNALNMKDVDPAILKTLEETEKKLKSFKDKINGIKYYRETKNIVDSTKNELAKVRNRITDAYKDPLTVFDVDWKLINEAASKNVDAVKDIFMNDREAVAMLHSMRNSKVVNEELGEAAEEIYKKILNNATDEEQKFIRQFEGTIPEQMYRGKFEHLSPVAFQELDAKQSARAVKPYREQMPGMYGVDPRTQDFDIASMYGSGVSKVKPTWEGKKLLYDIDTSATKMTNTGGIKGKAKNELLLPYDEMNKAKINGRYIFTKDDLLDAEGMYNAENATNKAKEGFNKIVNSIKEEPGKVVISDNNGKDALYQTLRLTAEMDKATRTKVANSLKKNLKWMINDAEHEAERKMLQQSMDGMVDLIISGGTKNIGSVYSPVTEKFMTWFSQNREFAEDVQYIIEDIMKNDKFMSKLDNIKETEMSLARYLDDMGLRDTKFDDVTKNNEKLLKKQAVSNTQRAGEKLLRNSGGSAGKGISEIVGGAKEINRLENASAATKSAYDFFHSSDITKTGVSLLTDSSEKGYDILREIGTANARMSAINNTKELKRLGYDLYNMVENGSDLSPSTITAIKNKLKKYGYEDIEDIKFVADKLDEGKISFGNVQPKLENAILDIANDKRISKMISDDLENAMKPQRKLLSGKKLTKSENAIKEIVENGTEKAAKDIVENGTEREIKELVEDSYHYEIEWMSANEFIGSAIGSGIKKLTGWSDSTLTRMLKGASEGEGGFAESANKILKTYEQAKEQVKTMFQYGKNIPNEMLEKIRSNRGLKKELATYFTGIKMGTEKELMSKADEIAKATGKTAKEVFDAADEELAKVFGYELYGNKELKGIDVLNDLAGGRLRYNEENVNIINEVLKDLKGTDLDINITDADGIMKATGSDLKKLLKSKNGKLTKFDKELATKLEYSIDQEVLNKSFKVGNNYTEAQVKEIKKLQKKYSQGKYKDMYDLFRNEYKKANEFVTKRTGLNLDQLEGYDFRHTVNELNEEIAKKRADKISAYDDIDFTEFVAKGNTKTVGERQYKMSVQEANNLFGDRVTKQIEKYQNQLKSGKLSSEQVKELESKIEFLSKPENQKLFVETLTGSFDGYISEIPALVENAANIDAIMVDGVKASLGEQKDAILELSRAKKSGDANRIAEAQKRVVSSMKDAPMQYVGKNRKLPIGYKKLDSDKEIKALIEKLNVIANQTGMDKKKIQEVSKLLKSTNGGYIALDSTLYDLLKVGTQKDAEGFLSMYQGLMNNWKKMKTLSPSFQLNNITGNASNMWLSGMSATDVPLYYGKATDVMKKSNDIIGKVTTEGIDSLTKTEKSIFDAYTAYVRDGFGDMSDIFSGTELPKSLEKYISKNGINIKDIISKEGNNAETLKNLVDFLPGINARLNSKVDNLSKLATHMYATDHPKYLKKLGVSKPSDAVRKVVFDPSELTEFEKKYAKNLIPFYTFTKKNLAFQSDNLFRNFSKYKRLYRGMKGAYNAIDVDYDTEVPDYMKTNMYLPNLLAGKNENGDYSVLRGRIPAGDLVEMVDNPIKQIANSSNPLLKLGYEQATGKSTFTGNDLKSEFGLSPRTENLISNLTGLDVPIKNISRFNQDLSNLGRNNLMEGLARNNLLNSNLNTQTQRINNMYGQLSKLENTMKSYKNKGYEFSTMGELKKANTNKKLEQLKAELARYK